MRSVETDSFKEQFLQRGRACYEVCGDTVIVSWRKFTPANLVTNNRTVVFLGGWPGGESRNSTKELTQSMANHSGSYVFSIEARANKETKDFLLRESEATRRFISDSMSNNIVISGHSLGGIKAVDLAYLIETKGLETKIDGLILFNSVGLYKTNELFMSIMSIIENITNTPKVLLRNPSMSKKVLLAYLDIINGILTRFKNDNVNFFSKASEESKTAASINPRLQEIYAPVIIIEGQNDLISNPNNIGKNVFTNSKNVRMIIAKKIGIHALPLFRSDSSAKVGFYLLNRISRVTRAPS